MLIASRRQATDLLCHLRCAAESLFRLQLFDAENGKYTACEKNLIAKKSKGRMGVGNY